MATAQTEKKAAKKTKREPSMRAKRAAAVMLENGGNASAAMRAVGYAESMARNPQKLTKTKAFQDLLEKYLPEEKVLKRHRQLLDKEEILVVSDGNQNGSHLEYTGQPHSDAKWAVEALYKLKGYTKEGTTNNVLIVQLSETAAGRYKITSQPA